MIVKAKQLFQMQDTIDRLKMAKLKPTVAFRIRKTVKSLVTELDEIVKTHYELLVQYGEKIVEGKYQVIRDSDKYSVFIQEFDKLMDEDIDIPQSVVKLSELSDEFVVNDYANLSEVMIIEEDINEPREK